MAPHISDNPEPFGALLGMAPGAVPVYSSHYDSLKDGDMPDRSAFRSVVDGIYMGFKWQCVELARRWLYQTQGYVFDEVAMAYEIFRLRSVKRVSDGVRLPLFAFRNGAKRPPVPGAMIIWDEGGEFETTGHVAIVTEVLSDRVRIAEQNVGHALWQSGNDFSRELPMIKDANGAWWLRCTFDDTIILGWVIQTDDPSESEVAREPDPALFRIAQQSVVPVSGPFLDDSREDDNAYISFMGGHRLANRDEDLGRYMLISESARIELKKATNELHVMFIRATDYVLDNPELLQRFNLPVALLPRIRQSWQNRRTHNITGRFDFAMKNGKLKVYEYNADSAGCHMECGRVQGLWSHHNGVTLGRDAGERLFSSLVHAWGQSHVTGPLHILMDDDDEEAYHALYMKAAAEAAGVRCKLERGLNNLGWDKEGCVVDGEGERIDWVWKTWAWETALDQLRDQAVDEEAFLRGHDLHARRDHAPRLIDVLLRPEVMVFEPLWSLIPSNKAILPVLWSLYPGHPYLLESHFELTDTLRRKGYVRKPIVGRAGGNVAMVDRRNNVLETSDGDFAERDDIYQELFMLPEIGDLRAQLCTFSVDGVDAGACLRCDTSLIIRSHSDLLALRIVPDEEFYSLI